MVKLPKQVGEFKISTAIYTYMIQQVSFFCCPIPKGRFMLSRQKGSKHTSWDEDPKGNYESWLRMLFVDPFRLLKLVRQYQSVSNGCISFFIIHLLFLLHQTIKSFIYASFVGSDKEKIDYLSSFYYPMWTTTFPRPRLFGHLSAVLTSYLFIIRLRCALNVLANSMKTANHCENLNISRLNFAESCSLQIPMLEFLQLLYDHKKHNEKIRKNRTIREAHYKVWDTSIHERLKRMSPNELIYKLGVIDFKECYSCAVSHGFGTLGQRWAQVDTAWHRVKSRPRQTGGTVLWPWLAVVTSPLMMVIINSSFVSCVLSLEMGQILKEAGNQASVTLYDLLDHLKKPLPFIRTVEAICLGWTTIPNQFESALVYFDAFTLTKRIQKLTEAMKLKLELCMDEAHKRKMVRTIFAHSPDHFDRRISDIEFHRRGFAINVKWLKELNLEMRDQVKMAKLLHMEFDNIRRQHFIYMSALIVFSGLCSAFCLSIYKFAETFEEFIVTSIALGISMVPTVNALIFFAGVEKAFKNLHITMNRLLVNEIWLLDVETVRILLNGSRIFERKVDRSMVIFGLYAITPDSVGPFIAFLITAAVLFERFMTLKIEVE